jgi:IclR family KDG regulon transcriptional repressor
LAFSGQGFVEEVIERGLSNILPKTITEPQELLMHLKMIKEQGFAVDDEENEEGIRCVGAPVFDYTGKVIGAISVSGPTVTVIPEKVEQIAENVIECAKKYLEGWGGSSVLR